MRFNDSLLAKIDAKAAAEEMDRSTWVRSTIMTALGLTPPPPKPKVPGKQKAPSGEPPKSTQTAQEPLLPPEAEGPCPHPEEAVKSTSLMTYCSLCGSRL